MKEAFKYITNYDKATVADIETDGLLDSVTKVHIIGFQMSHQNEVSYFWGDTQGDRIKNMLQWHIDNSIPMVFHNGIGFDRPALEKVYGMDLSELMVIDTLWVSYYLNINHRRHSVEALASDYGVAEKFEVSSEDWETLSKEDAIERVVSDVKIGNAVWQDFKGRLEEMYSLAKEKIDSVEVGGKRTSQEEKI